MDKALYYAHMREAARRKRGQLSISTESLGVREIRKIYRAEGIIIDIRKLPPSLKAIYVAHDDISVAIRKDLPDEPKIFALVHELKHHWLDQELIRAGIVRCGDYNENELVEKGAEVFAAEFIYPEDEFLHDAKKCQPSSWAAEDIIRFKRDHCRAKVSYKFIRKGLERRGLVAPEQFADIKFQKLEEEIYGIPFYKQAWFKERRKN